MTNEQAISWLKNYRKYTSFEMPQYEDALDMAIQALQADRGLNEWCHDCKEYDQEKHCCPRFNRVIRETLAEVQADKHCSTCRNEDTYHCAECENKSDYEQAQVDGDLISRQSIYSYIKSNCNPYGKPTLDFETGKRILEFIDNMPSVAIPTYKDMTNAEVFTQVFGTNLNRESVSKSWWEQKFSR